jgi:hypothetical protein
MLGGNNPTRPVLNDNMSAPHEQLVHEPNRTHPAARTDPPDAAWQQPDMRERITHMVRFVKKKMHNWNIEFPLLWER